MGWRGLAHLMAPSRRFLGVLCATRSHRRLEARHDTGYPVPQPPKAIGLPAPEGLVGPLPGGSLNASFPAPRAPGFTAASGVSPSASGSPVAPVLRVIRYDPWSPSYRPLAFAVSQRAIRQFLFRQACGLLRVRPHRNFIYQHPRPCGLSDGPVLRRAGL